MRLIRNLMRRKVRTTLTIVGISVGIWALVVMGSMANKISALVEGGSTYYEDKIIASDASSPTFGLGFTPIPISTADAILAVRAWRSRSPKSSCYSDPDESGTGFGLPDFVIGSVPAPTRDGRASSSALPRAVCSARKTRAATW